MVKKAILGACLANLCKGELSYIYLKGIEALVDNPGLSPLYGYVALKSYLPNRRFLGNYGVSTRGLCGAKKLTRIGASLIAKKDCPLDANSEWLQRLFPSSDGANFYQNQLESDPVFRLSPRIIGALLGRLAMVTDRELRDDRDSAALVEELTDILHRELHYTSWLNRGRVTGNLQVDAPPPGMAQYGKRSEFEAVASLLVGAVIESRDDKAVPAGFAYGKYFPEKVLLAYMVRRMNTKADLVEYFFDPQHLKRREFVESETVRAQFVADVWDAPLTPDASEAEGFIYRFFDNWLTTNIVPPLISMGRITASHNQPAYPDCGETSLRNWFNIMLFDRSRQQIDLAVFDQVEAATRSRADGLQVEFAQEVRDFFDAHRDVNRASTDEVRAEWALNVVSRKPGVVYKTKLHATDEHEQFEIRSLGSPANMFKLLGQLLFQTVEAREQWASMSLEQQTVALCGIFSRTGFLLTCSLRVLKDSCSVQVLVNGLSVFDWVFRLGHFVLVAKRTAEFSSDWAVHRTFDSRRRGQMFVTPLLFSTESSLPYSYSYLLWKNPAAAIEVAYAGDYGTAENQVELLESIADCGDTVVRALKGLCVRLLEKLNALEDDSARRSVLKFLRNTGYLFAPEAYAGTGFRPVHADELGKKFPLVHRAVMGVAWEIDNVFGKKVIAFTPIARRGVVATPGAGKSVGWAAAFDVCINPNPEEDRPRVRAAVLAREEALSKLRDPQMTEEIPAHVVEEIHRQFPVEGFSLLGPEQWDVIGTELLPSYSAFWSSATDTTCSVSMRSLTPQVCMVRTGKSPKYPARCGYMYN